MLASGRIFWKNVESVPKVFTPVRHCNAAKHSEVCVAIPRRIERGPTDILKALSSTIQTDPTAFAYKYPDDPYFYPFSNNEKRVYALTMESGRKSARWIVENNPGFFKNILSDPPIEAFLPKPVYDENSKVTEEVLAQVIERRNVCDAIAVYELLQTKGTVISNEVKQSLLELVCFYNTEEKPSGEELEFKWFANTDHTELGVNKWKQESFAEVLFKSMDPNCPLANSTIIQGMIKYNNIQKALEIFNAAKSNNVKFSVGVYNALLSQASNTSAEITDGLTFMDDLLKEMATQKVNPNLGTLNAALQSLTNIQGLQRNDSYVKKLVMEFAHLGISPSLGTYYYLFRIFGSSRRNANRNKQLIYDLLSLVESTNHEIMHQSDFLFFPRVMNLFTAVCKDVELVNRLNAVLFQNDNVKFLESALSESKYFRDYLCMIFRNEPIEIAMEKYREVVPTIYSPEYDVFSVMLSTIISNGSCEYLVEAWGDLKRCKMSKFMKVLCKILPLADVFTEEAGLKVIHEAALNSLEFFEESGFQRVSADTVSHLLIAFLKTGDDERALEVFAKVKDLKTSNTVLGAGALLSSKAIMELFQYAFAKKAVPIIMDCLRYANDELYSETSKMAETALPLLSESEQAWATQLINKAKEAEEESSSSE